MKIWKWAITLLLCAMVLLGSFPVEGHAAEGSGSCGTSANWTLDSAGTLTISGTGTMKDYCSISKLYGATIATDFLGKPWSVQGVTSLVVGEGITNVGGGILWTVTGNHVTSVKLADSVTKIGHYAFYCSYGLTDIVLPKNISYIGEFAFQESPYLTSITFQGGAPSIESNAFTDVTATCYYPVKDATWTDSVRQNYGGTLTWVAYDPCEKGHSYGDDNVCAGCGEVKLAAAGSCGTNLTWKLDANGKLTVSGTGAMTDYKSSSDAPWYAYRASVTEICIGDGVTRVGARAFYNYGNAAKITLPDSVVSVGEYAFGDCQAVTELNFGNGLTTVEEGAFSYLKGLTSLELPDSLTTIGELGFNSCQNVKTIKFPANLKTIGPWAFQDFAVTSLTIPEGVESIGQYAFNFCGKLTSISLPSTLKTIGLGAFNGTGLTSLTIPAGVENLEGNPLVGAKSLNSVSVNSQNTSYRAANGILYTYDYATVIGCLPKRTGSVTLDSRVTAIGPSAFRSCQISGITLPEGLKTIGKEAFYYCSKLTNVAIPAGVTAIEAGAFQSCTSLASVTLGEGLTAIGDWAFCSCSALTAIELPDSVTSIGVRALSNCASLTEITVPAGVAEIGGYCFSSNKNLTTVTFKGAAPAIESSTFYGMNLTCYYPETDASWTEDARQQYGGTLTWVAYDPCENGHAYTNGVCTVCGNAEILYEGTCGTNLTWTLDAKGVLTVSGTGDMASYVGPFGSGTKAPWYDCKSKIREVRIEAGVTSVGANAFNDVDKLTKVSLPKGIVLEEFAFYNSGLTELVLPENAVLEGRMVFDGTPVTSVTVPGTARLSDYAFQGCDQLTELILGEGLEVIANGAFRNCSALETVTVPSTVTLIETIAFENTGLREVTFTGNAPAFEDNVFRGTALTAYYPRTGSGWAEAAGKSYGGTVTWQAVCPGGVHAFEETAEEKYLVSAANCTAPAVYRMSCICGEVSEETFGYGETGGHSYGSDHTCAVCGTVGGTCGDNLTWTLDADGLLTISGTGRMTHAVQAPWFAKRNDIKRVVISSGVENIADYAFNGCANMTSVDIPETVTSIGSRAFDFCSGLTDIEIPEAVTSIGDNAFSGCMGLKNVTVPTNVTTIGTQAFASCSYLESIVLPAGLTDLAGDALANCYELLDVYFGGTRETWKSFNVRYSGSTKTHCGVTDPAGHWTSTSQEPTCSEEGFIGKKCGCGWTRVESTVPATGQHIFEKKVATETYLAETAKCQSAAKYYFSCECGAVGEETFEYGEPNGHAHESVVTAPTCTEDGYTTYTCHCGDSYVADEVEKLGHDMDEWGVILDPTCTEDGTKRADCTRCDYFETEAIDAVGHWYESVVVTAPTCTENGYTTYTCHCGDSYVADEVEKLGHEMEAWYIVENPTCTVDGSEQRNCSRCDYSESETLSMVGHDIGDWYVALDPTCTEDGTKRADCSRCDYFETEAIDAVGHWYESVVVTAPTCTENGYTTYACHCGDSYVADEVEKLGHDVGDWYVTLDPTCTEEGSKRADCSRCDYFETETIPADGEHTFEEVADEKYLVSAATCTAKAVYFKSCHCGAVSEETFEDSGSGGHAPDENHVCTVCGHIGGYCGDPTVNDGKNVKWELDKATGKLTITGQGEMAEFYGNGRAPWYTYKRSVVCAEIGEGITNISSEAFLDCTKMISITLPESLTSIDFRAFMNCEKLASIAIPRNVANIGSDAFYNCEDLTDVYISDLAAWLKLPFSEQNDWANPLYGTEKETTRLYLNGALLTSVVIPEGITEIPWYAFRGCSSITSVKLASSVTFIGRFAFYGCSISELVIPDGVEQIEVFAFGNCRRLETVAIGEGTYIIGDCAFDGCTALNRIALPSTVEEIESYVFDGCSNLWHVLFAGTQAQWNAVELGDSNENLLNATIHYNATADAIVASDYEDCLVKGICECKICNTVLTKKKPDGKHTFDLEAAEERYFASAATCTEAAKYYYGCECGAVGEETFEYGEPLGHDMGDWEVVKDATPNEAGQKRRDCGRCDHFETEEIPAQGVSLKIVTQPTSVKVASGKTAKTTVVAEGEGLTYTWYYTNNAADTTFSRATSVTTGTYAFTMTAERDGRQVYCVIQDQYGSSVRTETVTLSMSAGVKIVTQPVNVTAANGATAKTTVVAEGEGLTYTWYYTNNKDDSTFSRVTSITGDTYSIKMTPERDGRQIYCVIQDQYGSSVRTETVTLSMSAGVKIVTQPVNVTAANGATAKTTVVAEGEGLTYTWYYTNNKDDSTFSRVTSITGDTYSVKMTPERDGRQIYCVVADKYGNSVTSNTVTLSLAGVRITEQPQSVTAEQGSTAVYKVSANGESLSYQWQYCDPAVGKWYNSGLTGNKTATFQVGATSGRNGFKYRCVITDAYGNQVISDAAELTVRKALVITAQPESVEAVLGTTAVYKVSATGESLSYQWQYCDPAVGKWYNSGLTGNKTATFQVGATAGRNGFRYRCKITDAYGNAVYSDAATLAVK